MNLLHTHRSGVGALGTHVGGGEGAQQRGGGGPGGGTGGAVVAVGPGVVGLSA